MNAQHLSDEAVAAFADGVLSGHARDRAARHVNACSECRQAVKIQREAVFALRAAGAPELPSALLDRLRTVPMTTPITSLPTAIAPDGTTNPGGIIYAAGSYRYMSGIGVSSGANATNTFCGFYNEVQNAQRKGTREKTARSAKVGAIRP